MFPLKYTFYHLPNKQPSGLNSSIVQEHILKWSMKKCIHIDYYAFNQEFTPDHIDQFALDFFRDCNVTKTVQKNFNEFVGSNVAKVLTEKIPCTVVSMAFFDKLLDANNNIVCNGRGSPDDTGDHQIRQCMEVQKNGKYIVNNLQMMLFEDECEEYCLYDKDERDEFIFRLLTHFVIGGQWCQDDITVEPYLNVIKSVYRDLLTVEKTTGDSSKSIQVSSAVYKIEAFDSNHSVLFPKQNQGSVPYSFAYLIINSRTRTVTLFFHNVGATLYA